MTTLAPPKIVVLDASVLINFLILDRIDLLGALPGRQFLIPQEVEKEITHATHVLLLQKAISDGHVCIEESTDLAEIALATDIRQVLDKGESAALAMAQHRGWMIACDETGMFIREASRRLGPSRIMNTPGLLIGAIRAGALTLADADKLKKHLETARFRMRFQSFAEVV